MNKKNLMALFALALMALTLVPASQAAFNIVTTLPNNNSYLSSTKVEFNFKIVGDNDTYIYSAYNGTVLFVAETEIANNTAVDFNATPLTNGLHTFFLYVRNESTAKNNTYKVTTDTVAPTLSITAPTAGQSITTNDSAPYTTLTISVADVTAGLDKCNYEIYNNDVNGQPSVYVANTTIAACTASTTIYPHGGSNTVHVFANDSAGNKATTASVTFNFATIAVGGVGSGSGSGSGSGIVVQQPAASIAQTQGTPAASQPADNRIWWVVGIAVVLYLVFHKKKRGRR